MSKELTPLEALEKLGKLKVEKGLRIKPNKTIVSDYIYYEIIEKELKAQEKYVQIAEKEHEELMYAQKKLKALEIIKKIVKYDIEVNGNDIFDIEYEPNEMLTKEEFDLLKEVLL